MTRPWVSLKILLLSLLVIFSTTSVSVSAAAKGGKCSKVGQTQITKNVSYICVKSGSKAFWQVKPKSAKGKETSATTTTVVKTQTFFTPSIASDGLGVCEI